MAWAEFCRVNKLDTSNVYHRSVARTAFTAGWEARAAVNQETGQLDTGSLFPTMGLHYDH